LSWKQAVNQEM